MKARIVHAARETNQGKLLALDALQVVYRDQVAACVAKLIADRKTSMALGERVARNNRKGIHFRCQNCGRTSHADAVGAINLRGRSDDQEIAGCENPAQLRALLEARYLKSRSSARGRSVPNTAPIPFGRGLTTGSPGTAPNPRMS